MDKRKILIQLDSDAQPSVFDRVVAVDAGADLVFSYGAVQAGQVRELVHGAIFTRGPKDLNHTAFFIFSALSSSPNRDRLVSGKFTNGHAGVTRCFNFENTCRREAGTNPFRVLATYINLSPS